LNSGANDDDYNVLPGKLLPNAAEPDIAH